MQNNSSRIRVFLLGPFEVSQAEKVLKMEDWSRRKAALLFQRLAYERRLLKEQAIDFLWPESDLTSGSNNLYRALYVLRQTLDMHLGPGTAEKLFSFEDSILRLKETAWVDAAEFERLCQVVPAEPPEQRIARLEAALALYRGDFLPDEPYADWTFLPREALIRLRREASLALAEHQLEQRNFPAAIGLLSPLLASDPADELVHRELMRAYTLTGRRHDALRQYQACVDALESELDVPPGPETTAMYDQILSGGLAPLPEQPRAAAWSPPAPVSLDADRSRLFVGRQSELEALATILHNTQQDHVGAVLIAGESGVGKTHLAMEALRLAAESGMVTLLGAAHEQEGRLPFQPFIEAFDHFLAGQGRSLDENPLTHFQHLGSSDPQQEYWALFKATATFILDIANNAPLVFLVDDLHAADETSLQLFHYLARQTRALPVLLVGVYRIDSPTSNQFDTLVSALYREGMSETIRLGALPQAAVQEILESFLTGKVSEALCQAVFDITAGNPFFTQEIARALHRSEKIEKRGGYWSLKSGEQLNVPENLSALLRQKVSRLGHTVEMALTAAAVIGSEFRFEILRRVTALPNGEILDALDAALAGLLVEEMAVGYRFRHPLIRQTLYECLSRVRRADLHTRAAEAIEATYALRLGGLSQQVDALAYHYDVSNQRDRALPYLIQAGENAAGVYAFEVATDYFERALSLMDELGLPDPARRWRLLESLGWWHGSVLADTPKAVASFEQALALEPGPEWRPANGDLARLHCGAAAALITAGDLESAEKHLQAALMTVDENEDAPEYADLLYNLAQLHWHGNEYQEAMVVAQRSLAIAERLDKPEAIARAFEMLALTCHSSGAWQEGIAYEQQRAELAGAELDVTDAFDIHL
jgi:DNA-binding SARP family transcriptional activator/tetratricopeptide (TPR) repeat protein